MITLKCSDIIYTTLSMDIPLDGSVRQYKEQSRIIYLGQNSQVIQIPEQDIDKLIEFLNKVKALELTGTSRGWLK